jgi:maleamate amidohydrolase
MSQDLDQDYEKAGFGGRLAFGRSAAVVWVDVVDAYCVPDSPLYVAPDAALASMARISEAARKAGVPVIFTRVVYQPGGVDGGVFYKKVPALKAFDEGSPLGAFPKQVQPREGELIITKQYPSAFFGTPLASTLRAWGVDSLLMGGFSTSGCVRASALDALQHGFVPYVVRDACADRDPRPHEANLFDLQAKYAEVVDEAEALALLAKVARPA